MPPQSRDVTQLLLDWSDGDTDALDELMPLVAEELRGRARRYFERERPGHTLQPTALVNEVYLRLVDRQRVRWKNRSHFFGFAAQLMRRILVDHARANRAAKRGSGAIAVPLSDQVAERPRQDVDLIDLDDALTRLAQLDGRLARVVELRFFAGLTLEETAEVMDIGTATVSRCWKTSKAWLYRELQRTPRGTVGP